jgi:catalase
MTDTRPTPPTTSDAGVPVESDEHSLTIGPDGPILLHDHYLIEQMAAFNRERVPERQPHAKGSGAFGRFEVTNDVSAFTKAAVFAPGTTTETVIRFSTVAGERGSPDTWRDPRGWALKLYTTDGNYDIVGNNTPVFFIRDPPNSATSSARKSAAPTATCATTTCNGTSGHSHRSPRTRSPT